MNIRLEFNWTKLVMALVLMCSMFGLSAMAQTNLNETLDAKAVTALIEELTDGLPDLIEDEAQVTAILGKWDARQDLIGKTKAQILNLLFADVKSIIKEKETQDSIWAGWKESASNNTEV